MKTLIIVRSPLFRIWISDVCVHILLYRSCKNVVVAEKLIICSYESLEQCSKKHQLVLKVVVFERECSESGISNITNNY